MASLAEYKQIIDIIDKTFTYYEQRLVTLREETIQHMQTHLTRLTQGPSPGGSGGTLQTK